jgi:protein subunit release factor B
MTLKVKLDHIIEGMEVQSNETHSYLNKKTGMVELIDDEYMSAAEEKRNRKR